MAKKSYGLYKSGLGTDTPTVGTEYRDAGYKGTIEEVEAAYSRAFSARDQGESRRILFMGAVAAFNEGRPEALQTAIRCDEMNTPLTKMEFYPLEYTTADDVRLMTAKMEPQYRQDALDDALRYGSGIPQEALVEAGANPSIGDDAPLRDAAKRKDTSFVKLLISKGASFDDAILHARLEGDDTAEKNLRIYKEELGKPKADDLRVLQKQVKKLTATVNSRFGKKKKTAPQPKTRTAPR